VLVDKADTKKFLEGIVSNEEESDTKSNEK
jgi:hypothetical protein